MTPDGVLTVLHDFTGGSDGAGPCRRIGAGLRREPVRYRKSGGKNGVGVIFRATLTGVVTLHGFVTATGAFPGSLFQHTNGKLYGSTYSGGGKFGQGLVL